MSTNISWTDETWNPWQGCTKVSPGCAHCYMFRDKKKYGQDPSTVVRSKDPTFYKPLKMQEPALVFTCSWSDFFHADADTWRAEAWDIIKRTPHLTYQVLTKRPERILDHLPSDWGWRGYPNVWIGTSVENQRWAKVRIPLLMKVPAVVRFLSCEPLLGPVDLLAAMPLDHESDAWDEVNAEDWDQEEPEMEIEEAELEGDWVNYGSNMVANPAWYRYQEDRQRRARLYTLRDGIQWVIAGGESGPGFRPMDPQWARSLRDQCVAAGVPFFFKQSSGFRSETGKELDSERWEQLPSLQPV